MTRIFVLLFILFPLSARADQFDYILRFASFADLKADIQAAEHLSDDKLDFAADHAMRVGVTRISTGATLPGFFVMISLPLNVAVLRNHSAIQLVINRDKCNARVSGCIVRSTVGATILQDIIISPVYAGSDFPWGGFQ
jgi:hypothetical protein